MWTNLMAIPFFFLGGWGLLVLLAAVTFGTISAIERRQPIVSTLLIAGALVILEAATEYPPFTLALAYPREAALGVVGYAIVGLLMVYVKWASTLRNLRRMVATLRDTFIAQNRSEKNFIVDGELTPAG